MKYYIVGKRDGQIVQGVAVGYATNGDLQRMAALGLTLAVVASNASATLITKRAHTIPTQSRVPPICS